MVEFDKLPEFKIPELDSEGYIYYLFYRGGLVYIGQTVALPSRVTTHINTKVFDKVLYEACPKDNLTKRETELIKYYEPILNGSCNRNPKIRIKVLGDYCFVHKGQLCLRIEGEKLYDSDNVCVGELGENEITVRFPNWTYKYNLTTNEVAQTKRVWEHFMKNGEVVAIKEADSSRWEGDKPHLGRFIIHTYLKQDPKPYRDGNVWQNAKRNDKRFIEETKIQEAPDRTKKLVDGFVFRFGKYRGENVADVRKKNPNYILWYEREVLNGVKNN